MTLPAVTPVVTGLAASTRIGNGVAALFAALEQNRDQARWPSRPASREAGRFHPVTRDISRHLRRTRTDHRLTLQLLGAVDEDLAEGIEALSDAERERTSVVLGNTSGSLESYLRFYETGTTAGYRKVNPVEFPATMLNHPAVQLSNAFSITGANTTIGSGFSAGLEAIEYATRRLSLGKDRISLVGSCEELNELNVGLLEREGLLSEAGVPRPFAERRDGTVPAEGIGILRLEADSTAEAAGRPILARVLGCAVSPDTSGGNRSQLLRRGATAVLEAVRSGGLSLDDVDAIFPSANGTPAGDALESGMLEAVFGDRLPGIPVYPIKSVVGECFTAAGPLQCIAAVHALNHGHVDSGSPARGGLWLPDRLARCECALVYVSGLDARFACVVLGAPRFRPSEARA